MPKCFGMKKLKKREGVIMSRAEKLLKQWTRKELEKEPNNFDFQWVTDGHCTHFKGRGSGNSKENSEAGSHRFELRGERNMEAKPSRFRHMRPFYF